MKSFQGLLLSFALVMCLGCPEEPTASIAGTITAAQSSFTDSDVNDNGAGSRTPQSNNTIASPQDIPAPSTVGGYVNLANDGPDGRSKTLGDAFDFYRVSLSQGNQVVLFMGEDPDLTDLDLRLRQTNGTIVQTSQGLTNIEVVTAPSDGTYLVEVYPYAGPGSGGLNQASTYVLSIGQSITSAVEIGALRMQDDFRPGQVIVKMEPGAVAALGVENDADGSEAVATALGAQALGGAPDRELLLDLGNEGQRAAMFRTLDAGKDRRPEATRRAYLEASDEERLRIDTIEAVKVLRRRPDVKSADLNHIYQPMLVPNDPLYNQQWHYPQINMPLAWDLATGTGTVVAVIDTGIVAHPDINLPGGVSNNGYDFISSTQISGDGDGADSDPTDTGDRPGAGSSFHGTHVAGTVGATTNNGVGVAGVAFNTQMMHLRVLGIGGGTDFDIIQSVKYAAGLANDTGALPAKRADVMNLSLGGPGSSTAAQDAYTAARTAGVIIIAAAGNDNTATPSYPAAYQGVVSVSATDTQKNRSPYSNFGPAVDVAAPGGDTSVDRNGDGRPDGVLSTLADDTRNPTEMVYRFYQGTSMAAPHMAGVVALMEQAAGGSAGPLTPLKFDQMLAAGDLTEDVAGDGANVRNNDRGYGLIDVRKAVAAAQDINGPPPPANPTLSVTPAALNFGSSLTLQDINLTNVGGGALTANAPTESETWLSVAALNVDGSGLGTYRVTVNRGVLVDGTYQGNITITTVGANTVTVPVVMRVGGATISDTGHQFLLLVDPDTLDAEAEVAISPNAGQYSFDFSGVAPGTYLIIGGSDFDNDLFICHGGESCGAYPTLDGPVEIDVDGSLTGFDFSTGFQLDVGTLSTGNIGDREIPARGFRRLEPEDDGEHKVR